MNSNGIASQIICDIIASEMQLDPTTQVWLRDQNRKIPNDAGLYVIVGMVDSLPICANTYLKETLDGNNNPVQNEVNEVTALEQIRIELLSRSNDALMRNWEVIAALKSIYATQQQETNDFKICRIPNNFLNISHAEGGSTLNRYALTFSTFVWYRKTKSLSATGGDYYEDFTARVDDDKTIGTDTPMLEFEINQGGIVP